jgi:hypothetical protein
MRTKPTLNACLRRKRIYLNRVTITLLGNPSHISFWYDEQEHLLYITAAGEDNLDAYEIKKSYWQSARSCEMMCFAFVTALQHRLHWENDSKYSYTGALIEREGFPTIAFNMNGGKKVNIRYIESRQQRGRCASVVSGGGDELSQNTQKFS